MRPRITPRIDSARHAWLSAGAPIIGLVLLIGVLALLMLVGFARQQDRDFADGTRHLVQGALDGRMRALDALALDYANWDDAYANTSVQFSASWLKGMFYSSVADALIVFRPGESPRFVWFNENAPANVTMQLVDAASRAPNLSTLAGTEDPALGVAHTYAAVGDNLAIIGVTPITPENDAARRALAGREDLYYLAAVQFLDPSRIETMGHDLNLRTLSFGPDAAPDAVSIGVIGADGAEVGRLSWPHPHPGLAGLKYRFWLVLAALALGGFLTVLIARKQVERQVASLVRAESLVEASRLKSDFIATMSHELRSPINTIIGYAELIEEECAALGPKGAALREDSARITAAGRQLSRLVSDILDQSRLDAGRLSMQIEPVHAGELLAEVAEIAEPITDAQGNKLVVSPSDNLVLADHARLRQCLLNLVSHAAKSTQRGRVSLSAHPSADGAFLVFNVADTGAGMTLQETAQLFERFKPANAASEVIDDTASGLDLAISLKLARAMGGDIKVVSQLGKGSTFSVSVPVANQHGPVRAAAA
ncbi:MAG: ATP-binding protein [Hyphomonadaceae bacterium]|nr:ATP-binding protein [Hyphomonadaceae bacterium]